MEISRRPLLALWGAALLTPMNARSAWAQDAATEDEDPALNDIIEQELAESLTEALPPGPISDEAFTNVNRRIHAVDKRVKLRQLLRKLEREFRQKGDAMSTWPTDERSVDYRHLLALGSRGRARPEPFEVSHQTLLSISKAHGYEPRLKDARRVVFGLRGCEIADADGVHQRKVRLVESMPNHFDRRCVIGVWDRRRRTVAVFASSTVPNRVQVELHWLWAEYQRQGRPTKSPGLWMTNLLPQGLYDYEIGTHLEGARPKTRRQPGALRQIYATPILRAQRSASYTYDEAWDYASEPVGDNIHASVYSDYFLGFSSQGCQTVLGNYAPRGLRAKGAWAQFRRALGLLPIDQNTQTTGNDSERYPYLLTTGREARIHARRPSRSALTALRRLRTGSRGQDVLGLQRRLARENLLSSAPDGHFGRDTMIALLEFQKARRIPTDGVVTPELARSFDLPGW